MKIKGILILITVLLVQLISAQNDFGTIHFDRTITYTKLIDALPYLSQEKKDLQKLTWGKERSRPSPYVLSYTPEQTVYTYGEQENSSGWSWRQDEFLIIQDLDNRELTKQYVLGGKLYLLKDDQPRIRWKVENEIREVAGYLCMKATTQDTIKDQNIVAWFTDQIPVSSGPEGLYGLPGMILMVDINDGTAIIEATQVDLEIPEPEIPKKIKGKELDYPEYVAQLNKFMKDCLEGERNPFWDLRY